VNKAQLIDSLADRLGGKKAATEAVDAVLETIQRMVKDGVPVAISGFGVFEKVTVPARRHRNPRTGEPVRTKKTTRPKFRPGQGFKDVVNGTRKLPKVTAAATATPTKSTVTASRSTGSAAGGRPATKASTGSASTRAKKAPARKTAAGAAKATTKRASSTAKKSTAKKSTATRATATTSTAKKSTATRATAKKSTAKKSTAPRATKRSTPATSTAKRTVSA